MVVVIVLGLIAGTAAALSRRADRLRRLAAVHRNQAERYSEGASGGVRYVGHPAGTYRIWKAEKYERAARYPWLPIKPDPPERK